MVQTSKGKRLKIKIQETCNPKQSNEKGVSAYNTKDNLLFPFYLYNFGIAFKYRFQEQGKVVIKGE